MDALRPMKKRITISSTLCRPIMMEQDSTKITAKYFSPRVPNSPSLFFMTLVTSTWPPVMISPTSATRESPPMILPTRFCTYCGACSMNIARSIFSASTAAIMAATLCLDGAAAAAGMSVESSEIAGKDDDLRDLAPSAANGEASSEASDSLTELPTKSAAGCFTSMLPALASRSFWRAAASAALLRESSSSSESSSPPLACLICSSMASTQASASSVLSASISRLYSPLKLTTKICFSLYFLFSIMISVLAKCSSPFRESP
mmetsp:Transcript_34064/g.70332  ORF Transcript_34064/g.70332 Transcript_34064/m.70332 type:complete len:262 (-) Transcript_34064:255-1040(-)